MASTNKELSDAIAAYINGGTYDLSFTAEAVRVPKVELKDYSSLQVNVFTPLRQGSQETRKHVIYTWEPIVIIGNQVDYNKESQVDNMDLLCEAIDARLLGFRETTLTTTSWKLSRINHTIEFNIEWMWERQAYQARSVSTWQAIVQHA